MQTGMTLCGIEPEEFERLVQCYHNCAISRSHELFEVTVFILTFESQKDLLGFQ